MVLTTSDNYITTTVGVVLSLRMLIHASPLIRVKHQGNDTNNLNCDFFGFGVDIWVHVERRRGQATISHMLIIHCVIWLFRSHWPKRCMFDELHIAPKVEDL